MTIDVDDFLDQAEHDFAREQSQNMRDAVQNTFDLDGFNPLDSYDDNLSYDVFSSNNGRGGQGSLAFLNSQQQQPFFASSDLDGRWSSQNSQQCREKYQPTIPSSSDSQSSHHIAEHDQDSSDGRVKDIADSIEHENTAPEEEEEDEALLKNEERGSDNEFEEDIDENEDGQKKRNKRKPYSGPRSLIRWHSKSTMSIPAHDLLMHWQPVKINSR